MTMYRTFEDTLHTDGESVFSEREMKKIFEEQVDHDEYGYDSYSDWLNDMLRTHIFTIVNNR